MKIGVDLTFIKPRLTGGIEAYIYNLLSALFEEGSEEYVLFTACDNYEYFEESFTYPKIEWVKCGTEANRIIHHLLWQNTFQNRKARKHDIDVMFYPSYMMPFFKCSRFKTVTVVHDIQPFHYPEYFPLSQRIWFNIAWRKLLFTADRIVAISDYTKCDLEKSFRHRNNIVTISNPIHIREDEVADFGELSVRYGILKSEYYYTVTSMLKHKNLITLIKMIDKMFNESVSDVPVKLIVSGVDGPSKDTIVKYIANKGLTAQVVLTGFISDEERNALIRNCNTFLFPSIFEGFGMPPVEAIMQGARVVTTRCASLPEVTRGKCLYVDDPYDVDEWISKIREIQSHKPKIEPFYEYQPQVIARQFLELFRSL